MEQSKGSCGYVAIHLDKLIYNAELSKNRFSHMASMERTQINRFCKNEVTRVDLDVLARICNALDCSVGDVLEYVPPAETIQEGTEESD